MPKSPWLFLIFISLLNRRSFIGPHFIKLCTQPKCPLVLFSVTCRPSGKKKKKNTKTLKVWLSRWPKIFNSINRKIRHINIIVWIGCIKESIDLLHILPFDVCSRMSSPFPDLHNALIKYRVMWLRFIIIAHTDVSGGLILSHLLRRDNMQTRKFRAHRTGKLRCR